MSDEPGAWPAASAASGEEDDSVIGQEVRAAAREATAHARQYQRDAIDQVTLDAFHAEVARLSRMTSPGEQIVAFADMREIRDEIRRLLDRRLWPR
jgi:hypothetical protein